MAATLHRLRLGKEGADVLGVLLGVLGVGVGVHGTGADPHLLVAVHLGIVVLLQMIEGDEDYGRVYG